MPSVAAPTMSLEKAISADISSENFGREIQSRTSKFDRLVGTWDLHLVEATGESNDKIMVIVSTLATSPNTATIIFDLTDSTGERYFAYDQKARMIGDYLIFSEVKLNGNYTHLVKIDSKGVRGSIQVIADILFDCTEDSAATGESVTCTVRSLSEVTSTFLYGSMIKRRS